MKVLVTDRESIEQGLGLRVGHAVISITDPGRKPARIGHRQGLRAVLALAFDDAEPTGPLADLPAGLRPMIEADAQAIWRFVDEQRGQVEVLVVHCEMGMSRSPAVAAAVTRALGGDDAGFFERYSPNRYVYDLLLEARRKP